MQHRPIIICCFSQYTHERYRNDKIIEKVEFAGENNCGNSLPDWQEHPECTLNGNTRNKNVI